MTQAARGAEPAAEHVRVAAVAAGLPGPAAAAPVAGGLARGRLFAGHAWETDLPGRLGAVEQETVAGAAVARGPEPVARARRGPQSRPRGRPRRPARRRAAAAERRPLRPPGLLGLRPALLGPPGPLLC